MRNPMAFSAFQLGERPSLEKPLELIIAQRISRSSYTDDRMKIRTMFSFDIGDHAKNSW